MTVVLGGGFVEFRYFLHTFFVSLFLLGLIAEYLLKIKKFHPFWLAITVLIFLMVALFNAETIVSRYKALADKKGSDEHFVILGEIEPMVTYLMDNAAGQRVIQLDGNPRYLSNFFNAFSYLAEDQNLTLLRITRPNKITAGKPLFYLTFNAPAPANGEEDGHKIESRRDFGLVTIYKLANP